MTNLWNISQNEKNIARWLGQENKKEKEIREQICHCRGNIMHK
jgi:hypothetical protein